MNPPAEVKRLSALAQLVALYAETRNITGTGQLAKLTGFSERAIWKAKAELRSSPLNNSSESPLNGGAVHPEQECSPPLNNGAVHPEPTFSEETRAPARNDSHANKESLRDSCLDSSLASLGKGESPGRESSDSKHPTRGEGGAGGRFPDSDYGSPVGNPSPAQSNNPPAPEQSLRELVEASYDPADSDEERFWAAAAVLDKAGVSKGLSGRLLKAIECFAEGTAVLRDVAGAKDPTRYLGAIIRKREAEKRQRERDDEKHRAALNGMFEPDEPEFVRAYRREGYSPVYRRPDGNWEIGRWTFDANGLEIGG